MEGRPLGLLRLTVKRGINLAIRDARSSDPYVVITLGQQALKTRVVKRNCNPVWDEELTLAIRNPNDRIDLMVFDKDRFSGDDKMGEAKIDIQPYIEAVKMGMEISRLPNGCAIKKLQPGHDNCLADESCIVWNDGKITQNMILRLQKVECGELELMLEWIEPPGCRGLASVGAV